jgi:hypothetical protein
VSLARLDGFVSPEAVTAVFVSVKCLYVGKMRGVPALVVVGKPKVSMDEHGRGGGRFIGAEDEGEGKA